MKKVKLSLNFKDYDNLSLIVFATYVNTSMTGNVNYPNCAYTLSLLLPGIADFQTSITTKDKTLNVNIKRMWIERVLYALRAQVELECNNDEAIAVTSGFSLQNVNIHRVKTFSVKQGETSGKVELSSATMRGFSYQWEMIRDPINLNVLANCGFTTISSLTVNNLTPGSKYWFRVKPVKSGEDKPFSDPFMLHVI